MIPHALEIKNLTLKKRVDKMSEEDKQFREEEIFKQMNVAIEKGETYVRLTFKLNHYESFILKALGYTIHSGDYGDTTHMLSWNI